jgi:hypothetical protein
MKETEGGILNKIEADGTLIERCSIRGKDG